MSSELLESNVKFGIFFDRKSFVVLRDNHLDYYEFIDDFFDVWRDTIELLIKRHEENK